MNWFGIMLAGFLAAPSLAQEQPNTHLAQPNPAGPVRPDQPAGGIRTAADLLDQLESADEDLKSLDADILYERVFGLEGDVQERRGKLYYVDTKARTPDGKPGAGSRKFAIHVQWLKLGRQEPMRQDHLMIFDGEWLVEKQAGEKQIVKRQITRAGQGFDPLKVGEGPFPLPIGQKRQDILSRFDAVLLKPTEGLVANTPAMQKQLDKFVEGTHQIKLTPRQHDPNAELSEIRLWYREDPKLKRLLPRLARTVTPQGDVSLVQLVNLVPRVMRASRPRPCRRTASSL